MTSTPRRAQCAKISARHHVRARYLRRVSFVRPRPAAAARLVSTDSIQVPASPRIIGEIIRAANVRRRVAGLAGERVRRLWGRDDEDVDRRRDARQREDVEALHGFTALGNRQEVEPDVDLRHRPARLLRDVSQRRADDLVPARVIVPWRSSADRGGAAAERRGYSVEAGGAAAERRGYSVEAVWRRGQDVAIP